MGKLFARSFPPTIITSTFISTTKNDAHLRIQIDDEDEDDDEDDSDAERNGSTTRPIRTSRR
jgi:hypothetical protein